MNYFYWLREVNLQLGVAIQFVHHNIWEIKKNANAANRYIREKYNLILKKNLLKKEKIRFMSYSKNLVIKTYKKICTAKDKVPADSCEMLV